MKKLCFLVLLLLLSNTAVLAQIDSCDNQFPGDITNNGTVDISDLTALLSFLAGLSPAPVPLANGDPNGDCRINLLDALYLEGIFTGGPDPVDCTCILPDTCGLPGDVNDDGLINTDDILSMRAFVHQGGDIPLLLSNSDVNADCVVDTLDLNQLINFVNTGLTPPAQCACLYPTFDSCSFQNIGDVDNNGFFDIGDMVYLANFIFSGGPEPSVRANADINRDCLLNVNDFSLIEWYITNGQSPGGGCTCRNPVLDTCFNQYPGDFNSDGTLSISDMTYFTNWLHGDGQPPDPIANADANGDCIINVGDSKLVYHFLFLGGPPPVDCTCQNPEFLTVCCVDSTGNVDYDPADQVTIGDIVALVEYMFEMPPVIPLCIEEANVDGIGLVDIADLVYLVEFSFGDPTGPSPILCP